MHVETHDDLAIALAGLRRQDLSLLLSPPLSGVVVCPEQFDAPFGKDWLGISEFLEQLCFMQNIVEP